VIEIGRRPDFQGSRKNTVIRHSEVGAAGVSGSAALGDLRKPAITWRMSGLPAILADEAVDGPFAKPPLPAGAPPYGGRQEEAGLLALLLLRRGGGVPLNAENEVG